MGVENLDSSQLSNCSKSSQSNKLMLEIHTINTVRTGILKLHAGLERELKQ